jgi:hypothetical protein
VNPAQLASNDFIPRNTHLHNANPLGIVLLRVLAVRIDDDLQRLAIDELGVARRLIGGKVVVWAVRSNQIDDATIKKL